MTQHYTKAGVPLCLGCHNEVKPGQLYILVYTHGEGQVDADEGVTLHIVCLIAANTLSNPSLRNPGE